MLPGTVTSDSDLVAELIAASWRRGRDGADDGDVERRPCSRGAAPLEGAFSLVLIDETHVIGVRDPHGFRPLCLGQLSTRAGCSPPRRRRSTSSGATSSGSSSPARWW